jgi:hypothetical protein
MCGDQTGFNDCGEMSPLFIGDPRGAGAREEGDISDDHEGPATLYFHFGESSWGHIYPIRVRSLCCSIPLAHLIGDERWAPCLAYR